MLCRMSQIIACFSFVLFFMIITTSAQPQQCTVPILRVLAIPQDGFVNVYTNSTGTYYTGFVIDALFAIARLANFTFTINLGQDSDFGATSSTDGSTACPTGGVGLLASGQFDVVASGLDYVLSRYVSVDFTVPLFRATNQFLYNTYTGMNSSIPITLASSAQRDFLAQSNEPRVQAIWAKILAYAPTSLPATHEQAVALVKQGGYAYLGRTPVIDQTVCNSYGYIAKDPTVYRRTYVSFAVQKGSNWLQRINIAILTLQDQGIIDNLLAKWFPCSNFTCS